MYWTVCLIIALICLFASVTFCIIKRNDGFNKSRIIDSSQVLCAGVVIAAMVMFLPIYYELFDKTDGSLFEAVLISLHNVIRLFVVDGEFEFVSDGLAGASIPDWESGIYSCLFAILFVAAPLLTFTFVLSFFRNSISYCQYAFHRNTDILAFSELNEKSISLAESMGRGKKKYFTIFASVDSNIDGTLYNRAMALKSALFKKDIESINFWLHSRKRQLKLFAIGEDSSRNVNIAVNLMGLYCKRSQTDIYVFSTNPSTEAIINGAFDELYESDKEIIRVRRVNEVRSLINNTLFESGYNNIFGTAKGSKSGEKEINAVVVGMGLHGVEMLKALTWFGQMDGYRIRIDAFDIDANSEMKFTSQCPELMSPKFNGNYDGDGEARYEVRIHSGVDIDTADFDDILNALPETTYAFVALGNDEKNVEVSMKLRSLLLRRGNHAAIEAVVYDSEKAESLRQISNFKNQRYCIHFIGDLKSLYSESVIVNSEIEELALNRHLKWGKECEFWRYDYNYKSSVASAIHHKMKEMCGIPGAEKKPEDRSNDELWKIRKLEHRRWNAYMRSEGYVYGGTVEPCGRNDLAKMHNYLVPFAELPLKIQEKDDD